MNIEWNRLRSFDGSQNKAFEELCCQLARCELRADGAAFYRKGTPDAGVECFWCLPNGEEWAWQAKFFLGTPRRTQWRDLDDSIDTALSKHPNLSRLFICLPVDRADPRMPRRRSFQNAWDSHKREWEANASARGMSVRFEYWGQSEIFFRLSKEEHAGRRRFWFDEYTFSLDWFSKKLEEAVANAGDRYSPELNIELPIARCFEFLGRTPRMGVEISEYLKPLRKSIQAIAGSRAAEAFTADLKSLQDRFSEILKNFDRFISPHLASDNIETAIVDIPWNEISQACDAIYRIAARLRLTVFLPASRGSTLPRGPVEDSVRAENSYLAHNFATLEAWAADLSAIAKGSLAAIASGNALLLAGDAGQGKTHLLCDVAISHSNRRMPRILLHGRHFADGEPLSQMVKQLGLQCDVDEFVGALEAAAQAYSTRIIIAIDALNETVNRAFWRDYLAGLLTRLSRTPWLCLVVSVRSSYEKSVVPDGLVPTFLHRVEHRGFSEIPSEAMLRFFTHFGIQPTIPLLSPEFSNPLLLKLLCSGLRAEGLTRIPSGLHGVTSLFDFYLKAINRKLAEPRHLDYDAKSINPVKTALSAIAREMAHARRYSLDRGQAKAIVDQCLRCDSYDRSLFRYLLSDGILTEDTQPGGSAPNEVVSFTYERFADYQIALELVIEDEAALREGSTLSHASGISWLCADESRCYQNQGLVEALSVLIPDLLSRELVDVLPLQDTIGAVMMPFIGSLVWRSPEAFSRRTRGIIKSEVLPHIQLRRALADCALTVTAVPKHPLNAMRLHRYLRRQPLAVRDAWWSTYIFEEWGWDKSVSRLVEWAWDEQDKSSISFESMRLTAIMLTWFLTTSHRFLRDRATKALVRLLERRLPVLIQLVSDFRSVNDPYVSERLYAVAYGCALRNSHSKELGNLARSVYDFVFATGEPLPQVLLRDYARGVLELAVHQGFQLQIDLERVRPPYHSQWPLFSIPEANDLEHLGEWNDEMPESERSRVCLYGSLMAGDFSRYVVGSLDEWSSTKLGQPDPPSGKQIVARFCRSLSKRQRRAFISFLRVSEVVRAHRQLGPAATSEANGREFSEQELADAISAAKGALEEELESDLARRRLFEESVLPCVNEARSEGDENRFDGRAARRWILQKILNMGWTTDRFGYFDRRAMDHLGYGLGPDKPERIGKKYQWIAFHELLARLSDNFKFCGHRYGAHEMRFEGPWGGGAGSRDIDPSMLLPGPRSQVNDTPSDPWWCPTTYGNWAPELDHVSWLRLDNDLPDPGALIRVAHTAQLENALTLEGHYSWWEQGPPYEEPYEVPRRRLWYMLQSYLVKKEHALEFYKWAGTQDFMGKRMPESRDCIGVFLGELYWAPAYRARMREDLDSPWTQGDRVHLPHPVCVTTMRYLCEGSGYDCSLDRSVSILSPSQPLFDGMRLRWNGTEGEWVTSAGVLAVVDPSMRGPGPHALMCREDVLVEFLESAGLEIIWTLLGEKEILGGGYGVTTHEGSLSISGAYRRGRGGVEGEYNPEFKAPLHR